VSHFQELKVEPVGALSRRSRRSSVRRS
jgi:hypothetical protein